MRIPTGRSVPPITARVATAFAAALAAASCELTLDAPIVEVPGGHVESLAVDVRFAAVRDVVRDDRSIWVLDAAPPFVTRISLDDRQVVQFGGEGDGPGELRGPRAIQLATTPSGDAEVVVWDAWSRRVVRYTADGELTSSRAIEQPVSARTNIADVSFADPYRIRRIGERAVMPRFPGPIDRTADMARGWLEITDATLRPGRVLYSMEAGSEGEAPLREWSSVPLWDACARDIVVWSPADRRLSRVTLDGEVQESTTVPLREPRITEADIAKYLRWMARLELGPRFEEQDLDFERLAKRSRPQFERAGPVATDLRCGADGAYWLRMFDTSTDPVGRATRWARVDRSDEVLIVDFGSRFEPYVFDGTGALGVIDGPDGQRVARWAPSPARGGFRRGAEE